MELESGLFRILDEALTAYLAQHPGSRRAEAGLVGAVRGPRDGVAGRRGPGRRPKAAWEVETQDTPRKKGEELPPALAAMIEDRRADELDALEAARRDSVVALPRGTWRELETRAAMLGIEAELLADGAELRLAADLPATEEPAKE